MSRGGKREGAGRKFEGKESKVVRIPSNVDIQQLLSLKEDIQTFISAWDKEIHPTSPRDETARIMLQELQVLIID